MPDWLTHMGIGYFIIWAISKTRYNDNLKRYFWLFVIGMVTPDIERLFRVIVQALDIQSLVTISYKFTLVTHSLLGALIMSLFVTSFFPHDKDVKYIFLTLFIGSVGHLLVDMIMWPWAGMGISPFYPLTGSDFSYSFHLVWPGGFIPLIITGCMLVGTVIFDLFQKNFSVFNYNFNKI